MALDDDIRRLSRVPLLGGLAPEALGLLAFSGRKLRLRAGDRLYEAGAPLEGAYVVLSGEVELSGEGLPPRRVGPDGALAELALFAPLDAPSAAQAASEAVVMCLARETMRRVLEEFPEAAARTRARIAGDIERFAQAAAQASARSLAASER
jgi:CRP-like cAMP-binding protein